MGGAEPSQQQWGQGFASVQKRPIFTLIPEGSSALHPQPARAQGLWRDGKVRFLQLLPIASAMLTAWPPDLPSSCWYLSSRGARGGLFWCRTALLSGGGKWDAS